MVSWHKRQISSLSSSPRGVVNWVLPGPCGREVWSDHFSSPGSSSSKREVAMCIMKGGQKLEPHSCLSLDVWSWTIYLLSVNSNSSAVKRGKNQHFSHRVVWGKWENIKKCLAHSMWLWQMFLPTMSPLYHKRDWHKIKSRTVRESIWKCSSRSKMFKYLLNVWSWVPFLCCGMSYLRKLGKGKTVIALFPFIPCDFLSLLLHFLFEHPKKQFSIKLWKEATVQGNQT